LTDNTNLLDSRFRGNDKKVTAFNWFTIIKITMKLKILSCLVIILFLALFIETAYLLQLKLDQQKQANNFYERIPSNNFRFGFNNINPFEELEKMQKEFNDVVPDDLSSNVPHIRHKLYNSEDIEETENEYIIKLKIPDTGKNKVHVELKNNSLVITSESNLQKNTNKLGFNSFSKSFNSFTKIIPVPENIKSGDVKTEYKDGLLIIILPKAVAQEELGELKDKELL